MFGRGQDKKSKQKPEQVKKQLNSAKNFKKQQTKGGQDEADWNVSTKKYCYICMHGITCLQVRACTSGWNQFLTQSTTFIKSAGNITNFLSSKTYCTNNPYLLSIQN